MLAVSAPELAAIQAEAVSAVCDQSCAILRKTGAVSDGLGQQTATWSTIATTVAGLSEPTPTQLQNYDYMIEAKATWLVRMPVATALLEQDRLSIGTHLLEVQKVLEPRSYPALLSVLASEVS